MQDFGHYNLVWNNYQHFVVEVAKQFVEGKAPDWTWSTNNLVLRNSHEYVDKLRGVPVDMMATWLETLRSCKIAFRKSKDPTWTETSESSSSTWNIHKARSSG
ncbi:hypothetical protein LZ32DRAFT_662280 [Colletotrichum eremochloae]|nr:hypothetical protein LZ32DRAFT_662280 [Colletotrichum eremochloae]